jgi:hypothetical protein
MCRRGEPIRRTGPIALALAMLAALAPAPTASAQDDAMAAYLESRGLQSLLVARLEQLAVEASPAMRPAVLSRLAGLYAEQLDRAETDEARRRLIERADRLLRETARDGTEFLELAIARATYRAAERIAERWRLRAAEPEERTEALATLVEVAAALDELARRAERLIERSRNISTRAEGRRAITAGESMDAGLLLRGEVDYLAGWTAYYRGWLGDPAAGVVEAEERFERLLDLGDAGAVPSAVDLDRVGGEGYARAVLGMALVRGLSGRVEEVLRWMGPLDHPDAHPGVRRELPGWRLAVLVDAGAWSRVADELSQVTGSEEVPVDWYRMVATRALETRGDALADQAARTAVGELARRGELAIIAAVIERHGIGRLGDGGFLVRYVQAASDFTRVAEAHGRRVGADGVAREQWRDVAARLDAALAAPDAAAESARGVAADAERLLGWAFWYAGEAEEAWPRFAAAAERLPPTAAAEAAWMTIVCLDQLILSGRGEMREEVRRRVEAFLDRFPAHAGAPALRARRIADRPDMVAESDLEALMAVPRGHPQWRSSRETVAAVHARRFREGGSAAAEAGRRYLEVAEPLLSAAADEGAGVRREPTPAEVDMVRLALEIALDARVGDLERAAAELARIESWRAAGWDAGVVAGELRYRGVQWAMAMGRWPDAARRAEAFLDDGPYRDAWSRAAIRRVLEAAAPGAGGGSARAAAAWSLASAVLADTDASTAESVEGLRLSLAAAAIGLARPGDAAARTEAATAVAEAMDRVRPERPAERGVLQALGRAAGRLGDLDRALECWRTLSDGLRPPDADWYEARFEVASILRRIDPERALAVMRQHAVLEPDYGPAPWGPRLRQLHEDLEAAFEESSPPSPPAEGDGP